MEPLSDALRKRMENYHLTLVLTATQVVEASNRILPPAYKAKSFRDGVLTLEANTAIDAYLLKQENDEYIKQINAAFETPIVTKLKIRTLHLN